VSRIRPDGRPQGRRDPRSCRLPTALACALAWLALAVASVACATGSSNQVSEGHAGAPGVQRILLCPPNLVLGLSSEIQSGAQPVDREIVEYLELQGRVVDRIGVSEGRQQWKQAIADAEAAGLITRATRLFAGRLAQSHEFDAIVMPSLILFQTQALRGEASWDGVSRKMRIVDASFKGAGWDESTFAKGVTLGGVTGPVWVTSLHILVFTRDGKKVFEGRGGIDFVQEVKVISGGKPSRWEPRPNSSLFEDRTLVREGVERAFEPYLVPPDK
jgi:hypothetical protein